jgi:hypothetical protein
MSESRRTRRLSRFTFGLPSAYVNVTGSRDSGWMRRLAVITAALSLLAGAGTTAALGAGGVPPIPSFGGSWSHAEVNVRIGKAPHTLILDHGRIVQASAAQITLLEFDGSTVVVPLSPKTLITIGRRKGTPTDLRLGMTVETLRIDGGAAVRVNAAVAPGPRSPRVRVR